MGPVSGRRGYAIVWRWSRPLSAPPARTTAPTPARCSSRSRTAGRSSVHGNPDHPPTHGALCTKVSRYVERTYHPERVLQPLKRVGPKGSGRFEPVSWDEALDDIAARLKAIAGATTQRRGDRALQLRRHDGPGAGREHGGALLPQARRVAARPHDLLVGRRRGARRDLRRQGRHARRALRREPPDRHLGQQLDHLEPALLDPTRRQAKRAGAKLVCIDPRRTETAEKCHEHIALLPGTDGALALGADARADRQRLARPRLHRAPRRRLAGAARARAAMAAGARRRGLRHRRPSRCARWRATTARPSRRRSASTTACSACAAAATRRA